MPYAFFRHNEKCILRSAGRVLRVISGISNRTSCRQIFKDYNVLTLPSLYNGSGMFHYKA
jgi:hypothetical protein